MNTQAIQKKLDEYMKTATPEQVVKEFEDLGVELEEDFEIKIDNNKKGNDSLFQQALSQANNMNLIQQLQATPKWEEFQKWYKTIPELQYPYSIDSIELACGNFYAFKNFPFMFQKGVFEKFIESREGVFEQEHTGSGYCYSMWDSQEGYNEFKSFEELLIWYFNN